MAKSGPSLAALSLAARWRLGSRQADADPRGMAAGASGFLDQASLSASSTVDSPSPKQRAPLLGRRLLVPRIDSAGGEPCPCRRPRRWVWDPLFTFPVSHGIAMARLRSSRLEAGIRVSPLMGSKNASMMNFLPSRLFVLATIIQENSIESLVAFPTNSPRRTRKCSGSMEST